MADFKSDKRWSDIFIPEIKRILGEFLIAEAPFEEDAKRNTDLMVLRLESVRIGCRVRRSQYFPAFKDDFTIRADRPNGAKTEFAKVLAGWGNYFFYGFANEESSALQSWFLADMNVFRLHVFAYLAKNQGAIPGRLMKNKDGSSGFRVFNKNEFPFNFIVAES